MKTWPGILILFLLAGLWLPLHAASRSIAVAGFIDRSPQKDSTIHTVISKSLISILSKMPQVRVASYDDSYQAAKDLGYFEDRQPDPEKLLALGLQHNVRQVIGGEYSVSNDTLQVSISVYDTVSGELVLQRSFSGQAGLDMFDTIDTLSRNLAYLLLGRQIKLARLELSVTNTDRAYDFYIGGNLQQSIASGTPYSDTILAEETTEVSLKLQGTTTEVMRCFLTLDEDSTTNITYLPAGSVIIKNLLHHEAEIILDGRSQGTADSNGDKVLYNIPADQSHHIQLIHAGKTLASRKLTISEGASPVMVFGVTTARSYFFPVMLSLYSGPGVNAGIGYFIRPWMNVSVLGGVGLVWDQSVPHAIMQMEANASFNPWHWRDFSLWITASGLLYFPDGAYFFPSLSVEVEWRRFFFTMGARLNTDRAPDLFGLRPIMGIGYRF